jgi:hypothetical protein
MEEYEETIYYSLDILCSNEIWTDLVGGQLGLPLGWTHIEVQMVDRVPGFQTFSPGVDSIDTSF